MLSWNSGPPEMSGLDYKEQARQTRRAYGRELQQQMAGNSAAFEQTSRPQPELDNPLFLDKPASKHTPIRNIYHVTEKRNRQSKYAQDLTNLNEHRRAHYAALSQVVYGTEEQDKMMQMVDASALKNTFGRREKAEAVMGYNKTVERGKCQQSEAAAAAFLQSSHAQAARTTQELNDRHRVIDMRKSNTRNKYTAGLVKQQEDSARYIAFHAAAAPSSNWETIPRILVPGVTHTPADPRVMAAKYKSELDQQNRQRQVVMEANRAGPPPLRLPVHVHGALHRTNSTLPGLGLSSRS